MRTIGLTGGIASGKTTISEYLRERGVPVIDADKLGHRAYEVDTEPYRRLIEVFGPEIVAEDRTIDRRVVGGKVFGNPDEMKKLTDVVWPAIRAMAQQEIADLAAAGHAIGVLEAAVMIEAGWEDLVDEIWAVVVEPDIAVQRLASRNNLDEAAARARIGSQLSNDERTAKADVVITNNGTLEELKAEFEQAWSGIEARAGASAAGGNA